MTASRWRRLAVTAIALAPAACSLGGGTIPVAGHDASAVGMKMLRPGVTASACGATILPMGRRARSPLLDRALVALLATDDEADMVRGDVGRRISTVRLPMLGEYPHHH
jgi:hypothetical protein